MELLTKASYSDEMTQREKDNLEVAYRAACEGMVLLKNDGALPFRTKKIALYGPGAAMTIKGGTGSGEVNERRSVSILEGLEDRGFEISTRRWLSEYKLDFAQAQADYQKAKRRELNLLRPSSIMDMLANNFRFPAGRAIHQQDVADSGTDACIYVVSRQAGEGGDRRMEPGDFLLTPEEKEAIRFCAACYEHFVLVINSGSALDMGFAERIPGINAILYICQLGCEGGHAFADVISGAVSPSGKLADTWAKRYADIPFSQEYSYLNGDLKNEFYREGIYVGYRFFDSFGVEPAYPFGFGLSYTDFSIRCRGIAAAEDGRHVTVRASVANTGETYTGKEVAQLYVSAPNGKLDKEYQSLAAFAKTEPLAPGASQELELTFDLADLASYREADAAYVLEPGQYILRLGNSSRSTAPVGVLALDEEVVVSRHTHICPLQQPLEELHAPAHDFGVLPDGLPRLTIRPEAFETAVYAYGNQPPCPDDERVRRALRRLRTEEMADIVVGTGMFGGKNRFDLPGSVGNTTSRFWDRGLVNVALCDGPAGLRIQRRSTAGKNGKVKPVDFPFAMFDSVPGVVKKIALGDPEKEPVLYQYATAFPVAAALAQSWNTDLLHSVGRAVYREMKEYGCTFWLAPAMNIHRNPLCGRNFEYFSEDPRLTGAMASALTRGVQQEEGYYVTIKHFACNNQEDNRTFVSSVVGERALREIYLRGFEQAVRE
ncbi:MAG: glycoside hydrolase family 3 C-terminal domain-containing protein, partial [Oscillospiraceae bacterium]|nr:glycoside hydrolase family 3 C-terminal domain-containing protein [Oscillospiraceae bacterium]